MRASDDKRRLASSVVDRLLHGSTEVASLRTGAQDIRQLKLSVRRDLEDLLNTRRRCIDSPADCRELKDSLVEYGIPDFTGLNMSVPAERERARLEIERVIRRYEPRLKSVAVTVQANANKFDRTLRLRITGVLRTEPIPERVVFDSELEPAVGIEIKAVS
jgi:type VI secretion system protein ImpF